MAACGAAEDEGLLAGGASGAEAVVPAEEEMYLSVKLSIGSGIPSKRGFPHGGEDGDGREPGDDNENAVKGVTVFLLDEGAAWNTPEGLQVPILSAYYFNVRDGALVRVSEAGRVAYETKSPVKVGSLKVDRCKALAVVNADYSGFFTNRTWQTLGDVRDHQTGNDLLWQGVDEGNILKTNFLMSSTNLSEVTGIGNSTEEKPARAVLDVERLVARVDYRTKEEAFPVTDSQGQAVGEVTVLGAAIVNQLEGNVNLFKHVSPSEDYPQAVSEASVGRETAGADGMPTNWVVDAYPGKDKPFTCFLPTLTEGEGWERLFTDGVEKVASDGTAWRCLGYVRENTNPIRDAGELRRKATGVVFKARYDVKAGGFASGQDLYVYRGVIYPDLSSAGEAAGRPADGTLTPDNCAEYGITYYPGGICYYTYWVKHADDGQEGLFGTMEYGIVRNNLYQLTVVGAGGIGDPAPGDSRLKVEMAVKDWEGMDEEYVEMQ